MVNASRNIQEQEMGGKLELRTIPAEFHSEEGNYRLLSDLAFYDDFIPASVEWLFVFSRDSILCANTLGSLDDWLKYDWISAPK